MPHLENQSFKRYAVTVLAVIVAFLCMEMLTPWINMAQSPFLLMLSAVLVSAWYGGIQPGLLATALSAGISSYFFLTPMNILALDLAAFVQVSLFVLQGVFVSVLCELRRTAQRQTEISLRSLRSTSAKVTNILENMTDSVVMLDHEWRFTYANHHAETFLNFSRKDLLGQTLWDIFPEAVGSVFDEQLHQAVNQQITVTIEACSPVSGRWIHVRAYPSAEGLAIYFQDISERKQAEQAIQTLNQELEQQIAALQQSEARCDRLIANVPGVLYQFRLSCDRKRSDIPYMGPGCFELFEFEAEEIQQHPELAWDAIHPDDLATFQQSLDANAATGSQWQHEWRVFTRSGQLKWVRGISRADRQADGSVVWDGILLDITEQKRDESRFRQIFESNMIGINFADPEGRIVFANDAFLNLIGYTQAELRQQQLNWRDISPPESLAIDEQAATELIQNGVCVPYEKEYIRKDGTRVPVIIGAAKLEHPDKGCICFVVDISDRKQLENQLRQQTADLERANRAKDEFFAILSHELRTPLNAILGWSQLLQSRKLDQRTVERALETIERNAQTQVQLVDDLLDIARILQGKLELKICPVNLLIPIEAAIEAIRPKTQEKEIQLTVTIAKTDRDGVIEFLESLEVNGQPSDLKSAIPTPSFLIAGDSKRIQQIVWNLLSNAVKFTPRGGCIGVILKHRDSEVQIEVRDTGVGIAPQVLPEIFAPFHQADSTNTRHFGGLGLGLAIVRQLVEMHGGTVIAKSPGQGLGATFVVQLPLNHKSLRTNHSFKETRRFNRALDSSVEHHEGEKRL